MSIELTKSKNIIIATSLQKLAQKRRKIREGWEFKVQKTNTSA